MPVQPVPAAVKCPTCQAGSASIERQSLGKKALKVGLVGVLAIGSINKTFKCNACGYAW
jgi:rubredoxin